MAKDLWQSEAAKLGGNALVNVIEEIRNGQDTIIERLDQMDTRHLKSENAIAAMTAAFPSGDIDGHRRYHETMIETLCERRRLRAAIQEKTISGLIWSAIMGGGLMVWRQLIALIHGGN